MGFFTSKETIILLLSLCLMLGAAKFFGEIFKRLKLSSVIGEITAGILIGPTILGRFFPEIYTYLFPANVRIQSATYFIIMLGVILLLLTAGLEVDLSSIWRQGKNVIWLSIASIIIPLALGMLVVYVIPAKFGVTAGNVPLALYIGVALSISALPIIAKILMDLNLFQTDFGMLLITSAMLHDIIGWILFSIVVQLLQTGAVDQKSVLYTVMLTLAFAIIILTVVRYLINKTLPIIQLHTTWPGGVIAYIIILTLFFSAITEAIQVHAIFGAFLAGIAIGDSPALKEHTKDIVKQFINNFFAPLFFISIGMRVDFINNFDWILAAIFISADFTGKISGALLAGKFTHTPRRQSLALGSGLTASGIMGIILGMMGLEYKIINESTFVAIVIMAIFTSLICAPLIKFFLKPQKIIIFSELLKRKLFIPRLKGKNVDDVVTEMSQKAANYTGIPSSNIINEVLKREKIMSTGIGDGVAIPHARLNNLKNPCIVTGLHKEGVDFDAIDGKPAKIIFLILTPENNPDSQIQILAQIASIFTDKILRNKVIDSKSFMEFQKDIILAQKTRVNHAD